MRSLFIAALVAAALLFLGGVVAFILCRKKRRESLVMVSGALFGAAVMAVLFSLCLGFFMR